MINRSVAELLLATGKYELKSLKFSDSPKLILFSQCFGMKDCGCQHDIEIMFLLVCELK